MNNFAFFQKKKKKNKKNKEGLQKKKEEKRLHLEEQYKNIELPSFKGALVDTINMDESLEPKIKQTDKPEVMETDVTETEVPKKKKKKQKVSSS